MSDKILVIDDEEIIRRRLKKLLRMEGYEVLTAESGARGLEQFQKIKDKEKGPVNIALVDIKMQGIDGIEVLKRIKKNSSQTEVIVFAGHGGVDSAIQALRMGAFDYITKPIEYEELTMSISRALEKQRLVIERKQMEEELKKKMDSLEKFNKLTVGRELRMKELKKRIKELEARLEDK